MSNYNLSQTGQEVQHILNNSYEKPASGIPKTDLAAPIQTSLNHAEAAYGQASMNASDIEDLQELYEALQQSQPVPIRPSDPWPVANPSEGVIYRVVDRVNTPPQYYTDYMWDGTDMVEMAQYNNAIDEEPTEGSHNLVESGGVFEAVQPGVEAMSRVTPITNGEIHVEPKNWLNFADADFLTGQRIREGVISSASSYNTSGYVPVKQNETYTYAYGADLTTARLIKYLNFYDNTKTYLAGSYIEDAYQFTVPAGAAYVRITAVNTYFKPDGTAMLYYGAAPSEYSAYFEPYTKPAGLKEGIVEIDNISPSAFDETPTAESNNLITSGAVKKYVDESIPDVNDLTNRVGSLEDKMDSLYAGGELVEPKNWINYEDPDFLVGYYLNANGVPKSGDYNTTGFIPLKPSETYNFTIATDFEARQMRYVNFYDSEKNHISGTLENVASFTTPSGAAYARVSAMEGRLVVNVGMLYTGTAPTEWSAYFEPYYSAPHLGNDLVTEESIQEGAVTPEKLGSGVLEKNLSGLSVSGMLNSSETINAPKVFISANYVITALVVGSITSVKVGIAGSTYGRAVRITPTSVEILDAGGSVANTYAHGLTLGSRTTLMILKEWGTSAIVRLFDDDGNYFEQSTNWRIISGQSYATNEGSAAVETKLTFMPTAIRKNTWVFGDSYLSYLDPARWIYYAVQFGMTNFLLDARGGENPTEGLADLQNLLTTGAVPRLILWAMGMNASNDSDGNVNSSYVAATEAVMEICRERGIELVLATIPTVPARPHTALNAWVRASGYRYVDFAEAVEATGTTYWKNWGQTDAMLSSDETHPTSYGAKALLSAVLADFPELTIL